MSERLRLGGRFHGRARWMPVVAVVVAGAVFAGTVLASAAGPALARKSPAQLLVAMRHARVPRAMSAVISETANLGFPAIPDIGGLNSSLMSAASLVSGTHTVEFWYSGARHVRIAVPVPFGETDLRVNGKQIWLWDSHGQTATRYVLPAVSRGFWPYGPGCRGLFMRARAAMLMPAIAHRLALTKPRQAGSLRPLMIKRLLGLRPRMIRRLAGLRPPGLRLLPCLPRMRWAARMGAASAAPAVLTPPRIAMLTPLRMADRLLALAGKTTKVSVAGTVTVAGRPAYQLAISPRTSQSLVSRLLIAVDAQTYLPLRVQVYAADASAPAFEIGFTSLTLGQPAMSNFTFTPPPGAHVKIVKLSARPLPVRLPGAPGLWGPGRNRQVSARGHGPLAGAFGNPVDAAGARTGVRVFGSGWLTVVAIGPSKALSALEAGGAGLAGRSVIASGAGAGQPGPAAGPGGQLAVLLRVLLNAARKVQGPWGTGKLIRTSLFSVLITSKGQVLVGAVTPGVLYADAAAVK